MAKIINKKVLQAYFFTVAKFDYTLYQHRIRLALVDYAQRFIQGKTMPEIAYFSQNMFTGSYEITLPIRALYKDEDDRHSNNLRLALRGLRDKTIEYEDKDKIVGFGLISRYLIHKNKGFVTLDIDAMVWQAILDIARGWRVYEIGAAMQMNSVYAMRFYEMFSQQKEPITHSIADLRKMFNLENKYKQINDFLKRVIEPAKQELDKKSPYSFTYKARRHGRKYTHIDFYPVFHRKNQDPALERKQLQQQTHLSFSLTKENRERLSRLFGFTPAEMKRNIDLLEKGQNSLDFGRFLDSIATRAQAAKNPKGYVISALKKELSTTE